MDLELRFAHPWASWAEDVVVWVEVKHGASPHEHQLTNYLHDLARLGVRAGAVVLLASRWSYPFDDPVPPPPEVPQRTWEQAATRCSRWARGVDGMGRFLVDEFLAYLQKESLMDPEVVSPVQLAAIAEYWRANESVASACDIASAYIVTHWNERLGARKVRGGVGYWETYPPARLGDSAADWSPGWWDWNLKLRDWEMQDSRGGVPVFIAGVCAEPRDVIVSGPEGAAWMAKLNQSHGFVSLSDGHSRCVRFAYPEELLVGRTLHKQGERLGKWVVETYEALHAAGPPPGLGMAQPTSD